MKKIERIGKDCFFKDGIYIDTTVVRTSDLDAQEAYIKQLEDEREEALNCLDAACKTGLYNEGIYKRCRLFLDKIKPSQEKAEMTYHYNPLSKKPQEKE